MSTDFTKFENQFQKHEAGKSQQAQKGRMAVNDFGRPEAFFVYGQAQDAAPTEFTVDIDMAEVRTDQDIEWSRGYVPARKLRCRYRRCSVSVPSLYVCALRKGSEYAWREGDHCSLGRHGAESE